MGLGRPTFAPRGIGERWGFSWRTIAVLAGLLYFTVIGGTRAGTYHFPLVAFSHLVAFTLLGYWAARRLAKGRWLPRTPLDLPLLALFALNLLSALVSTDLRISAENLAHLSIFILIYYLVVDALQSGWKVSDLVRPMLLVAGVVVLVAILELAVWLGIWLVGTGEVSPYLTLGEYRRRLVMGPANVLAWYVVLLLPLVLAQLLTSHTVRARVNLGALALGSGLVLASTLSRSGLIGMAAALVAFALLAIAPRVRVGRISLRSHLCNPAVLALLLVTALFIIALVVAAPGLLTTRLYTVSVRLELWQAAGEIIARRPLVGGGPGTFGYLFHQVPDCNLSAPDTYYNNAHNAFINVAAESGLPSLVVSLWLIAALFRAGWSSLAVETGDTRRSNLVTAACIAGVGGLLVSTLFDVPWVFPLTTLHVVLFAAIIVAPLSTQRVVSAHVVRWTSAVVLVALASILVWGDVGHHFQYRAAVSMQDLRFEDSVADLRKSVTLDPLLTIYQFQLGTAGAYLGLATADETTLNKAIEAYEQEIARGGDTPINNANLAWLEWNTGDIQDAVGHMERAAAQAPRDSYYALGLGYLYEEADDLQAATQAYSRAIADTPALIDSAFWQTSEHRRAFRSQIETSDALPDIARAWAAYLQHNYQEAAYILEGLPNSETFILLQGRVEAAQGHLDSARQTFDEAVARSNTSAGAYLARGQFYLGSGDQEKALHDLRIAGLLGMKETDLLLGDIAYQAGDLKKAIALCRNSAPDCVALSSSYDYASQVYHRSDIGADFWPESITCAPYDHLVPYYFHLAMAYRAVGSLEDAEDVCRWLGTFYEASYLEGLDVDNDRRDACPAITAQGRNHTLPLELSSMSRSHRGRHT
jgi:tetratricopeptide (TPR) repeat protein/O-antigen ligase